MDEVIDNAVDQRRWERYAGIAGILFVAALVVANIVGSPVNPTESATRLVGDLRSHRSGILAGVDLQFAAAILFVLFLFGIVHALRRAGAGRDGWGTVALVTGVAGLTTVLVAQSILGTLTAYIVNGSPAAVSKGVYAAYAGVFQAADILLTLFLGAAALAVLASNAFPRWTAWAALLGAVGLLLGAFSYADPRGPLGIIDLIGLLFFAIFIIATSVVMLRGTGAR